MRVSFCCHRNSWESNPKGHRRKRECPVDIRAADGPSRPGGEAQDGGLRSRPLIPFTSSKRTKGRPLGRPFACSESMEGNRTLDHGIFFCDAKNGLRVERSGEIFLLQ